ncbi:MAG: S49 family peptidase [Fimbriimonadaceae bacterium]|nr:S49 family peptidase [Fimbriimonadaceae bacterium]
MTGGLRDHRRRRVHRTLAPTASTPSVDGQRDLDDPCAAAGSHGDVDDQVIEIVLLIDSPGGQSSGLGCLADDVRMAAQKTMVADLSSICASAAYWVASQCSAIVASPYAQVGVCTLLVDDVERWSMEGYSLTLISSGEIKGKWAQGQPVDEEPMADAQREVDAVFGDFAAAGVSRARQQLRLR